MFWPAKARLASAELPALLYFLNIQILKAFPVGKAFSLLDTSRVIRVYSIKRNHQF